MVSVLGAGLTAKKIKDKIEEKKKEKQSRNPNPKTPKMDTDNNESSNGGIKKIFDVDKSLKKDDRLSPELIEQIKKKFKNKEIKLRSAFKKDKAPVIGNVKNLAKGGRAGYRMGGKCKLAKKGKGRAYGKNS